MTSFSLVKKKIIISMIAIILLVITLFGITYAYFTSKVAGNRESKSIEVKAGSLEITYDGKNSYVELVGLKPNKEIESKVFTVKNTGKNDVDNYDVFLENVINELKYYKDLTYVLECISDGEPCEGSSGVFPKDDYVLVSNSIKSGVTHSYKLTLKYSETLKDQSDDMNKIIQAKVNIKDDFSKFSKFKIYGNTDVVLAEGSLNISPESPATIKSLGTLVTNNFDRNYGKYQINVIASSKNLMDLTKISTPNYEVLDNGLNIKIIASKSSTSTQMTLRELCPDIIAGEEYTISYVSEHGVKLSLGDFNSSNYWKNNTSKVITEDDLNSIVIFGENTYTPFDRIVSIKNIQIEKGKKPTYYDPYINPIVKFLYLDEPLRCINEICDYVDLINNVVYRNVGKVVYGENDDYSLITSSYWYKDGVTTAFSHSIPSNALSSSYGLPVVSNMFMYDSTIDGIDNSKPYISGNNLQFVFSFNNYTVSSLDDLKTFLKDNNLEILYQLDSENSDESIEFSDLHYLINRNISICDNDNLCASKFEIDYSNRS